MKENFAYVLEFMLTFDKKQNTSPLMCTKLDLRTENFESYSSFFILYAYLCLSGILAQ